MVIQKDFDNNNTDKDDCSVRYDMPNRCVLRRDRKTAATLPLRSNRNHAVEKRKTRRNKTTPSNPAPENQTLNLMLYHFAKC